MAENEYGRNSVIVKESVPIHNKEKPFNGTKCSYAASQDCNLKQHVASIHNKEKRFHCTKCHYDASLNCDLKQHVAPIY